MSFTERSNAGCLRALSKLDVTGMNYCVKCRYYGTRTKTCDFLLITGHRRGCPVEDCARYEREEKCRPDLCLPAESSYWLYVELGSAARAVQALTRGVKTISRRKEVKRI